MDQAPTDRVVRMVASLELGGPPPELLHRLCAACTDELDVTGAAVALVVADEHRGALGASDDVIGRVEELQYALGEGPTLDAHHSGLPVEEPDLASSTRWAAFGPAALELGVGALFAFPLGPSAARLGALDLYRRTAGPLPQADRDDAVAMSDVATTLLAHLQAEAPPGSMAPLVEGLVDRRSVIQQAAGMVSVQLGIDVADAHATVRARAFADGRGVAEVATDIVARRLRLAP